MSACSNLTEHVLQFDMCTQIFEERSSRISSAGMMTVMERILNVELTCMRVQVIKQFSKTEVEDEGGTGEAVEGGEGPAEAPEEEVCVGLYVFAPTCMPLGVNVCERD